MSDMEYTIPDDFWTKLKEKYIQQLLRGEEEWTQEYESLKTIVIALGRDISFRYKIKGPLGVGGIGVVIEVEDKNLGISCALKFPRPKTGKEELFAEIVESEIAQLLKVRHTSIIEVYYQGKVQFEETLFPYYIMEYISGGKDALEYFMTQPRGGVELLNLIKQAVDGIEHLHKMDIVHLDIKLENMLISTSGRLVISDLGSARSLSEGPETTLVIFTREFAHPELVSLIVYSTGTDPKRIRANVERAKLKKPFDLYALGKNVLRLLKLYDEKKWKGIDSYTKKYLKLLACRLLDGKNTDEDCAIGLPREAFNELKYKAISEVVDDIKKLTGNYPLHQLIPEMNEQTIQTIQTSSVSPTPFTNRLSQIIKHPSFRRLAGISQLGFISLVYPTATHSRLEHVLGTFSNAVRYCKALYYDPVNPFFRQIMNDKDMKALLLATLLHDLGQYPLAHDLEEAEPDIFSHEEIAIEMLENSKVDFLDASNLRKIILEEWGVTPQSVANIINADPTDLNEPIKDRILHTIIDGPIDADKLDYLVRDSVNLNVSFGKAIDFERLLQCLTIIFKEEARKVYVALGIHEKGKIQAETIAFVRYVMFGAVYWHHTSRAAKAMLHRAVWESLLLENNQKTSKEYRAALLDFIFYSKKRKQLKLFPEAEKDMSSTTTQLLPSDREMLDWLSKRTSPGGVKLLEMISNREIYKRLLVISKRKNARLWEMLTKIRDKPDRKMIVDLQREVQNQMVAIIRNINDTLRHTTSALEVTATDKVIALSEEGVILILIDIPGRRPGSTISLEYLPEEERQKTVDEWKEPSSLEDSIIWIQLHDLFLESVGKIRVLCHPDARSVFEAAIKKREIEKIVETAIRYLQK